MVDAVCAAAVATAPGGPLYGRLEEAIGRTGLLALPDLAPAGVQLWAKLEGSNPTGSLKDRIALAMLDAAEQAGRLRPGQRLVVPSSGNAGISFAMLGRRRGYPVTVVTPRSATEERKQLVRFYGARLVLTDGPTTADSLVEARRIVEADPAGGCLLDQYSDPANSLAHELTTGAEIVAALPRVDAFVAGLGSGGTLMGAGRALRARWPDCQRVAVVPTPGERIPGIRNPEADRYWPAILNPVEVDRWFPVRPAAALATVREVGRREGLFLGPSAGAVLYAARAIAAERGAGTVVALLADAGWKYLSIGICPADGAEES